MLTKTLKSLVFLATVLCANDAELINVSIAQVGENGVNAATTNGSDRIILKVRKNFALDEALRKSSMLQTASINIKKIKSFPLVETKVSKNDASNNNGYKLIVLKVNDIAKVLEAFKNMEGVISAEKDQKISVNVKPNDTFYNKQWGLSNIEAEKAWDKSVGS